MTRKIGVIAIVLGAVACTTHFSSVPDGDADSEGGDSEDTSDDGLDSVDADGDGWTVAAGDCCDSNWYVHPGQVVWFDEPYECPEPSWDYDCSGSIEFEPVEAGYVLADTVGAGCYTFSEDECASARGWSDPPGVACGITSWYFRCMWDASDDLCEAGVIWAGDVACH